jgi:hypothetical protein
MTLEERVIALAQAIGADIKTLSVGVTPIENNVVLFADFIQGSNAQNLPYFGAALNGGSSPVNSTNLSANRPGVVRLTSSTTINSGYRWQTDNNIRLGGKEVFQAGILLVNIPNITLRAGFHDSNSSTDAVDGVYLEVTGAGAVVLKTANNNVRTTSALLAQLVVNVWYKFKITMNADATSALGEIFNESNVLIGSQTITTNIPKTAGRELGAGVTCSMNATTAVGMIDLDYLKTVLKPAR